MEKISSSRNLTEIIQYYRCPGPFVLPENPLDPEVRWIEGTNCAYPCRNAIYSSEEYAIFERTADISAMIGLLFVGILIISWSLDRKHNKKGLVLLLAYLSAITSIAILVTSTQPYQERFCKDNAIPISHDDGATTCAAQSFMLFYAGLACCYSWCAVAIALFAKVVMNMNLNHQKKKLRLLYVLTVFGLPLLPLIYIFASNSYGYGGNLPWCLLGDNHSSDVDLYLYIIPVIIVIVTGFVCQTSVIITIIRTSNKVRSTQVRRPTSKALPLTKYQKISRYILALIHYNSDKFNSLKTPCLFVACFLLVWGVTFSYRAIVLLYHNQIDHSFTTWRDCIFSNYDGKSDISWQIMCGRHSKIRMSVPFTTMSITVTCGQSIFVFFTFMTKPTLKSQQLIKAVQRNVSVVLPNTNILNHSREIVTLIRHRASSVIGDIHQNVKNTDAVYPQTNHPIEGTENKTIEEGHPTDHRQEGHKIENVNHLFNLRQAMVHLFEEENDPNDDNSVMNQQEVLDDGLDIFAIQNQFAHRSSHEASMHADDDSYGQNRPPINLLFRLQSSLMPHIQSRRIHNHQEPLKIEEYIENTNV